MADPFQIFDELLAEVRDRHPGRNGASRYGGRTGGRTGGRGSGGRGGTRGARAWDASSAKRWARRLAVAVVVLALPFFVLLRASTWLYRSGLLGTWSALLLGAGLTFILLSGYAVVATRYFEEWRHNGRRFARSRAPKRLLQGVAVLVVAYCAYGLVFLSGANAKTEAVRSEYRSLHPMLRLAVATLVLADDELLVTDAGRVLDDYAAMGLPPNERSLHLEQADGYAHALDLRTNGRSAIRNAMTRLYFAGLGFRTLRHVGTADHLHVSLPVP